MSQEELVAEMRRLRERLPGVTDTVLAAVDGMLVAEDTAQEMVPEALAAMAAATLGLARRLSGESGRGALRQTVAHCSGGCAAVYAVGETALLLVLGDEGLNIGRLHLEAGTVIDRIADLLRRPVTT